MRRLMFVIAILMSNAGLANAIPLTIQSGALSAAVNNDFEEHFSLQAPGFAITGGGGGYDSPVTRLVPHIGLPTDLGGSTTVTSNSHVCESCGGIPFAVQFKDAIFADPTFKYSGKFTFSSVIPNTQSGPASAPFSFTGSLVGQNAITGQEVFNLLLDGGGVVRTSFIDLGGGALALPGFEFDFAPIPEPATWLLLGTGLLSLMCFRKRLAGSNVQRFTRRSRAIVVA